MYAVNQYDAVAESYDSLCSKTKPVLRRTQDASMLFNFRIFLDVDVNGRSYSLIS